MITLVYNNRTIEVQPVSFSGHETVHYEGELVSRKWSLRGASHLFTVDEDGYQVTYEVVIGSDWHSFQPRVEIRRNGKLILSTR
ncbi:MAG: hypothetical protein OHK0039_26210 [Bacteroidia bacterium]